MAFENLSRRHAIKIATGAQTSVEECGLAVGEIVGHDSVVSASRMNGSVVLFLDNVEKVNEIVSRGVVVNDQFLNVLPLVTPAKRVTLSNVPPFIKDEVIERELSRFGKLVSPIKKVPLGCKSPLLKHVVSFRRHVFMVLNDYTSELNVTFKFKVDHFDYVVFATTESMKCFGCGKEGHLIRACPEKKATAQDMPGAEIGDNGNVNGENSGAARQRNVETGSIGLNVNGKNNLNGEQNGCVGGDGEYSGDAAGEKETGLSSDPELTRNANATVSQASVSNVDISVKNNENVQEDNNSANDMINVMMEKITNDLMVGKDKTDVGPAEPEVLIEGENMDTDDSMFKIPKNKRKKSVRCSSRAKKSVNESSANSDTLTDNDNDSSDSLCSPSPGDSGTCTVEMIKHFLAITKNARGVKVEKHFPDTKDFIKSVQHFRRLGSFTEPEVHRLRKFMTVLNHQTDESDDETA